MIPGLLDAISGGAYNPVYAAVIHVLHLQDENI